MYRYSWLWKNELLWRVCNNSHIRVGLYLYIHIHTCIDTWLRKNELLWGFCNDSYIRVSTLLHPLYHITLFLDAPQLLLKLIQSPSLNNLSISQIASILINHICQRMTYTLYRGLGSILPVHVLHSSVESMLQSRDLSGASSSFCWRSGAESALILYILVQVVREINGDAGSTGARRRTDDLISGAGITWIPPWTTLQHAPHWTTLINYSLLHYTVSTYTTKLSLLSMYVWRSLCCHIISLSLLYQLQPSIIPHKSTIIISTHLLHSTTTTNICTPFSECSVFSLVQVWVWVCKLTLSERFANAKSLPYQV